MAIVLWSPSGGYSEYKWYALIRDGEVVRGAYDPPPEVDLEDEEALLARYNGPGTIASRFDDLNVDALQQAESALDEPRLAELKDDRPRYRCTVCGGAPREAQSDGSEQRWMECPNCEKDRFFEPTTT